MRMWFENLKQSKKSFSSFSIRKKTYFCEKQKVVCNLFNLINVIIIIIIANFFNQELNLKKYVLAITILLVRAIDEISMTQQCRSTSVRFCLPCAQLDRCSSPTSDLENKNWKKKALPTKTSQ